MLCGSEILPQFSTAAIWETRTMSVELGNYLLYLFRKTSTSSLNLCLPWLKMEVHGYTVGFASFYCKFPNSSSKKAYTSLTSAQKLRIIIFFPHNDTKLRAKEKKETISNVLQSSLLGLRSSGRSVSFIRFECHAKIVSSVKQTNYLSSQHLKENW